MTDDPETGRYVLLPEQAMALTDPDSPAYLPGFFQLALGSVPDSPRIMEAARTGPAFGWHEHGTDVLDGCERFFLPGYHEGSIQTAQQRAAGLRGPPVATGPRGTG